MHALSKKNIIPIINCRSNQKKDNGFASTAHNNTQFEHREFNESMTGSSLGQKKGNVPPGIWTANPTMFAGTPSKAYKMYNARHEQQQRHHNQHVQPVQTTQLYMSDPTLDRRE